MHESQRASLAGRLILVKRNPVGSQPLSLHHGHFHGKQLGNIVFCLFLKSQLQFWDKEYIVAFWLRKRKRKIQRKHSEIMQSQPARAVMHRQFNLIYLSKLLSLYCTELWEWKFHSSVDCCVFMGYFTQRHQLMSTSRWIMIAPSREIKDYYIYVLNVQQQEHLGEWICIALIDYIY